MTPAAVEAVFEGLGEMGNLTFLENVVELKRFWTKQIFAQQLGKSLIFEKLDSFEFDTTLVSSNQVKWWKNQ